MTETSRYWTGRSSEGSPGDSGSYSDDQFSEVLATEFGQNKANRGVLRGVDDELEIVASSPADTNVNLSTGAAFVQGRWYYNNASVPVAITSNSSGSTRIDVIVLEADYTAQTVRVAVVQGTPGAGIPALTQSASIWQIPLAYITLASGFTSIANSAITDMREYANISANVGVDVTNSSGAALDSGSAVIWLAGGGAAINTTTVEGSANVAGVIEGRVANGASGRIITHGITSIFCDETVAVGDYLSLSTTAGQAQKRINGTAFARVLTANTGAGTRCLAYVNVSANPVLFATGTYTGDGAATKAVTGVGFRPKKVVIFTQATTAVSAARYVCKTDQDGLNATFIGSNAASVFFGTYDTDIIISLDNDGFTVGDMTPSGFNATNINARVYSWAAWG